MPPRALSARLRQRERKANPAGPDPPPAPGLQLGLPRPPIPRGAAAVGAVGSGGQLPSGPDLHRGKGPGRKAVPQPAGPARKRIAGNGRLGEGR